MWPGFDPELRRQFEHIRKMAALQHRSPTHEWPLSVDEKTGELLVVREWPDGTVTAYLTAEYADRLRRDGA
jgi:hypothetical protein